MLIALIATQSITLKYFEPGPTFHHQVELSLKKMDKVYDFFDLVECVQSSNSKRNLVKVMDVSDFFYFHDYASPIQATKIRTASIFKGYGGSAG